MGETLTPSPYAWRARAVSGEGGVDAGRVTGRIRGGPLAPDLRPATELTAQPPLPASAMPLGRGGRAGRPCAALSGLSPHSERKYAMSLPGLELGVGP